MIKVDRFTQYTPNDTALFFVGKFVFIIAPCPLKPGFITESYGPGFVAKRTLLSLPEGDNNDDIGNFGSPIGPYSN